MKRTLPLLACALMIALSAHSQLQSADEPADAGCAGAASAPASADGPAMVAGHLCAQWPITQSLYYAQYHPTCFNPQPAYATNPTSWPQMCGWNCDAARADAKVAAEPFPGRTAPVDASYDPRNETTDEGRLAIKYMTTEPRYTRRVVLQERERYFVCRELAISKTGKSIQVVRFGVEIREDAIPATVNLCGIMDLEAIGPDGQPTNDASFVWRATVGGNDEPGKMLLFLAR